MPIQIGQIIKNLIPSEPVIINHIQQLGSMVSLSFTGVTQICKQQSDYQR